MMRLVPRGADTYLFRDASHASVGWLRGPTVRFTGFSSRRATIAAAVQGARALVAYAGAAALRSGPAVARPPDDGGVSLAHEGGDEWVIVDGAAVARLVPPPDGDALPQVEEVMACGGPHASARACGAATYSVEFVLAPEVSAPARLTLAQTLWSAVRASFERPARRR